MKYFNDMNLVSRKSVIYDNENLNDEVPPFLVDNVLEIESCMVCSNKESMLHLVSMSHEFVQNDVNEELTKMYVPENNNSNGSLLVVPLQIAIHEEDQTES